MNIDFIQQFNSKYFELEFEEIKIWAKTNPEISNVQRGLSTDCFVLLGDFEQTDEICFAYITNTKDEKVIILKLQFQEDDFYNFLLCFCLEVTKTNDKLEVINIYNTFIHQLRTFLEANDIITFASLDMMKNSGFLVSSSQIEIIKSFNRIKFYRKCLGYENYKDLLENIEYVYLMINEDDFTFKIGQSRFPKYRERTLQSKQPNVSLLKAWQCDKKIEKKLHEIYKDNRLRGEWFKLNFGELCGFDSRVNELITENL